MKKKITQGSYKDLLKKLEKEKEDREQVRYIIRKLNKLVESKDILAINPDLLLLALAKFSGMMVLYLSEYETTDAAYQKFLLDIKDEFEMIRVVGCFALEVTRKARAYAYAPYYADPEKTPALSLSMAA